MRKIIDIHVHTFPEKIASHAIKTLQEKSGTVAFTDGTITALEASMSKSGVNHSVLLPVATKASQVTSINNYAIKLNLENAQSRRIISFGAMHPEFENFHDELERISKSGIVGIKLHPVYQGVDIDDERFVKILGCAGEFGLITMIHAGWDVGFPGAGQALPEKILRALKNSGNFRVILAHMGGWKIWREACELFRNTQVYIDTAFSLGRMVPGDNRWNDQDLNLLSKDEFVRIIRDYGSERVIFGTDSPWSDQAQTIHEIESIPELSQIEKANIFFNNAAKLLRIA